MLKIILTLCYLNCVFGNFIGPFVLWGRPELETFDVPALESANDKLLRNLYSRSTAVIMFLRNSSDSLNVQNYPKFKEIIDQSKWTYLSQHWLSSDPFDYNSNIEAFNLIGDSVEQDTKIDDIYKQAIKRHGDGNVLGILATKSDNHDMNKREADNYSTTISPTEEPMNDNFIYIAPEKAVLYTTNAPRLIENGTTTDLLMHGLVTTDITDGGGLYRIIVMFKVNRPDSKLTLRFHFPISNGYWTLTKVEIEDSTTQQNFTLVGKPPNVPVRFSYKCSEPLLFKNQSSTLTLQNIQVQLMMNGSFRFAEAYNCVGFTTVPIWSGILVTVFIGSIILLALFFILEIKPPNKFENSRSKQLTLNIQE